MRSRGITWRESLAHAALLVLLLTCAFPAVFFKGKHISSADILFMVPPWDKYAPKGFDQPQNRLMFDPIMAFRPDFRLVQEQLSAGEWPLWNPLEYCGVPLLANCQSKVFYPPHLLLAFMDVDTAMTAFVLLKLWLCGMTAYVCARLLRLSVPAGRFFSVAWMLGSFCFIWSNWPLTDVAAWIPVIFVGLEFLFLAYYRRGFFMITVGATLLLLAGHPETAFSMGLGLGMYFFGRLLWELRWGRRLWMPIGVCGAAWAVALLFCAVQLAPFIEYLSNSFTLTGRDVSIPLPAGGLVTFWVPRFFGTEAEGNFWDIGKWNANLCAQQYSGMAVWCGLVLLLARASGTRDRQAWRARIIALGTSAALVLLICLDFPTLHWVHELPLFSSLLEIYFIVFVLFAVPLLGTVGLERWFSRRRRPTELLWLLVLLVGVGALVAFLLRFNSKLMKMTDVTGYVHEQVIIAAVFAVLAIVILAISCWWRRPKVLWPALTALLVIDLLVAARGFTPFMSREQMYPDTELTRFMQDQDKPCRFSVAEAFLILGTVGNYGVEEWLGYDGLFPERPLRFRSTLGAGVWDVMEPVNSIQYYLHDPRDEAAWPLHELVADGNLELVAPFDGLEVYKNHRAFPRAFLAATIEVIPDRDALFARMLEEDYRPDRAVVTQEAPSGRLPQAVGEDLGKADIVTYEPALVVIEVDAKEDAVLVLSDAFYPGWRAQVDDDPVDIFPAYYAFRGVVVPAGPHTVEFVYSPWSFHIGLVISTAALAVGLVVGFICLRTRRRGQPALRA